MNNKYEPIPRTWKSVEAVIMAWAPNTQVRFLAPFAKTFASFAVKKLTAKDAKDAKVFAKGAKGL